MTRWFLLAACACALIACSEGGNGGMPTPEPEAPLEAPWAGRANPLPDSPDTVARGEALFQKNCSPCHGPNADGKGPSAAGITPQPANFRDGVRLSSHSDAYLFMRIATGKHGTAMPAFSGVLSEDERWAILRFLRSLPGAREKDSR